MKFFNSSNFRPIFLWLFIISLPAFSFSQSIDSSAQDSTISNNGLLKNYSITAKFHYGFLWAHRKAIEDLVTGHTTGFEISIAKQTDGSKWWQQVYNYPQTGFSFIHLDLANEFVGNANAIVAFISLPLVRKKNFFFSLRLADGLGYLSKRFQRVENHKDLTVGSHLNGAIQIMADTRFRIAKKIFLNLNYGITHFSNGSFRVPNLGVNNISLNGGMSYVFSEPVLSKSAVAPPLNRRWLLDINYGFGVKENISFLNEQYFAHTICFSFLKPVSYKSKLGIGGDMFYDLSLIQFWDPATTSNIAAKIIRGGAHVSYELQVNKFTILLNMGGYLLDQAKLDGSFYHRFGFKYELGKHLFANLTLKSHFARADYLELGAGWRFFLGKER